MTVPGPRGRTNVSVGGSFLFLRRTKEGAVDGQGGDHHSDGRLQDVPYANQGDDSYAKSIYRSKYVEEDDDSGYGEKACQTNLQSF